MSSFETKDWDMRNVWPMPSGELAVRSSLVNPLTVFSLASGIRYLGGFSINNPRTDMVVHYVFCHDSTSVYIKLYTEDFIQVHSSTLAISAATANLDDLYRTGFSYAVVEDEILITSALFASYWGKIGSGLIRADTVASVNTNFTAVNVPRGICVGWAGRAVVAEPSGTMWFSDALAPRTFVPQNAIDPPGGAIYGLHVNAGGALIICTTTGVYALPEDAAATGQIVVGVFSKLTDYACIAYDTTCVSRGRVFGLTERGFRLIDQPDAQEVQIDEKYGNRSFISRLHFNDYRDGKIFGGQNGPIVSISGFMHPMDMSTGFKSWWVVNMDVSEARTFDLRGLLFNDNGEEFFLHVDGPKFKNNYNSNEMPTASCFGRVSTPPEQNPVIREVMFKSNSPHAFYVQIEGTQKSIFSRQLSPKLGTDTWDTAGLIYREQDIVTIRTNWAVRTNNVGIEIILSAYGALVPEQVDILFKGPGRLRVT